MKKLFAAVQNHPVLYDPSDCRFGDAQMRAAAWKKISRHTRQPDAEMMWKRVFIRRKGQITVEKVYRTELSWLEPFIESVGSAAHREISLVVIAAVRKLPELYDSSHQLYGDRSHTGRLWEDLRKALNTSAKCRWKSMRDVYESTLRSGASRDFWYGEEMEWLRPYLQATSLCGNDENDEDSARSAASPPDAAQDTVASLSPHQINTPKEATITIGLEEFGLEDLIPGLLSLARGES